MAFRTLGITYLVIAVIFAVIQYMESDSGRQEERQEDKNYVTDDDPDSIEEIALLSRSEGATNMPVEESTETTAPTSTKEESDIDEGARSNDGDEEMSVDHKDN